MRAELSAGLAERSAQGLYRRRELLASPQAAVVRREGRDYLNFCSNDYLGLAHHPEIAAAFKRGVDRWGTGSGAAHLVCGHTTAHQALEQELAAFVGRERALLFSTGYMANLGIIAALTGRGDSVIEDRLNHASLIDGARLAGAQLLRYRHADALAAQEKLVNCSTGRKLLVSDGVFSMDGDIAPLPDLVAAASTSGAWLMLDDAHGLGVLAQNGAGVLAQYGLNQDQVPILMGTLGKAFGCFGAFVAGCEELIETLIQQARTYVYTTSLPPALAEATRASLVCVQRDNWRRERWQALVQRFQHGAASLGLPLMPSTTPIQPLLIGNSADTLAASRKLAELGIWVTAIRPPTVPVNSARLRITVSAAHEETHIDQLLDALVTVLRP